MFKYKLFAKNILSKAKNPLLNINSNGIKRLYENSFKTFAKDNKEGTKPNKPKIEKKPASNKIPEKTENKPAIQTKTDNKKNDNMNLESDDEKLKIRPKEITEVDALGRVRSYPTGGKFLEEIPKPPPITNNNEKYKISHNYEKVKPTSKKEKKILEDIVSKMLREEGITAERAEEIKTEIRHPLNQSHGRHLNKIHSLSDVQDYMPTTTDFFFYNRTFQKLDNLLKYQREQRDLSDPAYIQLRSQHKLVPYSNMIFPLSRLRDVRQNVNSKDWLKTQPRMQVNYSYNIEGNKEFKKKFDKYCQEDLKKTEEKEKLLKYIKLYPENQQVKNSLAPKHLPNGITSEMIPDYNVDISNYKPGITKKSRRKFDRPTHNLNLKNYVSWRCFDRQYYYMSDEFENLPVELIPKNLINKFGPPCLPLCSYSTGQYYFEDSNLDLFLVTDNKQTTEFWGPNYPDEFYQKQAENVKPALRKPKWPIYQEFWDSNEPRLFRIYYNKHSEMRRFKKWLKVKVNGFNPLKQKTMDQILDEKFGTVDDYSDFTRERKTTSIPAIHHYDGYYFMDKDEIMIDDEGKIEISKVITEADGGELFDYDQYIRDEARKEAKKLTE